MFKDNEIKLKSDISNIIKKLNNKTEIQREIAEELISRGLSGTRYIRDAIGVFSGQLILSTLESTEDNSKFLFLFAYSLNKILEQRSSELSIDVENYFTQLEYDKWVNYKEVKIQENIFPITLEEVQELEAGKIWQTTITCQQLHKLSVENLLRYNFKTQRFAKITVSGEEIDFMKDKSIEIANRVINKQQFPDHIKINVLKNLKDKVYYNPKNRTLVIEEGSTLNIFDGYHRKVANEYVMESNPDINYKWGLIITNLSEDSAKDYMVQIDKQRPIKKSQIKQIDFNLPENLVLSVISDSKLSMLKKVMVEQETEIGTINNKQKGLTTKLILADVIKDKYTDYIIEQDGSNNEYGIREIGEWIIKFSDYLMMLYSKAFNTNKQEAFNVKLKSYINNKNMFYGYIALSAKLYDNDDWEMILKDKMAKIDFSKDNKLWKDIGIIGDNNINKKSKEKIYSLFEEGL